MSQKQSVTMEYNGSVTAKAIIKMAVKKKKKIKKTPKIPGVKNKTTAWDRGKVQMTCSLAVFLNESFTECWS